MSFAKTSALIINKKLSSHFLILLLVSVLIQLWPVFLTQPARFAVRIAICNALLLVCAAAIFRSLPGKILAFFNRPAHVKFCDCLQYLERLPERI
jgi:uncharacterized membrane protein YczE